MSFQLHGTLADWRIDTAAAGWQERLRAQLHTLHAALDDGDPAWIHRVGRDALDARIDALLAQGDAGTMPLLGVPCAVKDNIDVLGMPTTAACPAFTYTPTANASSVQRLLDAGAVVMGKTNLDQFATGLVGTRSPYGTVPNAFDRDYVSGGSSSGSGSVVARGLVPFALGTDTAGSGRVPAGFNNIVGLKPSKGLISTAGVVPACRSQDCVSVFALTVADAASVAALMSGPDARDDYSRQPAGPARHFATSPRFGIPDEINWFGDDGYRRAWQQTLEALRAAGAEILPLSFAPMYELARLLYGGAFVAERHAAVGHFIREHAQAVNPVVRGIIATGENFSASDAFRDEYRRAALAKQIHARMAGVDALLVPTTPCLPRIDEVAEDPVGVNSRLGTFTNFVNLADLCALALPAALTGDGLPFGITLIAPAWQDDALAEFGARWQQAADLPLGTSAKAVPANASVPAAQPSAGYVRLAVVGAHLTGMPLNAQLTERRARFVEQTCTAPNYRLFALPGTVPPKPGLQRLRESEAGGEIIVELWDVPLADFGSFVALIPAPLGIGTLTLCDGSEVKGFVCEGSALEGALDITSFGGWRAYLASLKKG
jgi:allophanate hydrolase